jgi:P-type Ca2+ transporter type 2C
VSSIASAHESSALTAVQLLWVNLLQDTLAALALATDPPSLDLLARKPERKESSLISFNMWKMILGQSILQLAIILILYFDGANLFPDWDTATRKTVVFNTFVWLQIFNEINCRPIDNKLNVFSNISKNPFFIFILLLMIVSQISIIFGGGAAFSVTPLNKQQWFLSVALGFMAIPAGAILRVIPNKYIRMCIPKRILMKEPSYYDEERQVRRWNQTIGAFQDDPLAGMYQR